MQQLWAKQRKWDDPNLPEQLLQAWKYWESELPDASEKAYGSLVCLIIKDHRGIVEVAFVDAKSCMALRKKKSTP